MAPGVTTGRRPDPHRVQRRSEPVHRTRPVLPRSVARWALAAVVAAPVGLGGEAAAAPPQVGWCALKVARHLGILWDPQRAATLTAPGCVMGEILVDDVRNKLEMIPTVAEADVELVFDPPWNRNMMSEAARLETGML